MKFNEGWKSTTLGEIVNFRRGHDLTKSDMINGKIPVIGSNGIIGYHNKYTTKAPCLTIGRSGNTGKPHFIDKDAWAHNTTLYIDDFKGNNPKYIYYLLQTLNLSNYQGGSAVPTLNRNHIHPINVTIPSSIKDQKSIARILSLLDDKIILNNKLNDNLDELGYALYRNAFVENFNEEWKKGTISDLGEVIGGSTPSKSIIDYFCTNGIAWLTPKDLSNNKNKFIAHGEVDITEAGLKNSSAKIMPKGTVLFSSRAPIGYIAIAKKEVSTNQGFKSVVPYQHIGTAYVFYYLKDNLYMIENMASGSTFKEVSGSVMKKIGAVIPDESILRRFDELCRPIFEQQEKLEEENITLIKARDLLLPRLMLGEINLQKIVLES